jgi:hypothetical protein
MIGDGEPRLMMYGKRHMNEQFIKWAKQKQAVRL